MVISDGIPVVPFRGTENLGIPFRTLIVDSESTLGWCTQLANSQLIPQSSMKYLGVSPPQDS